MDFVCPNSPSVLDGNGLVSLCFEDIVLGFGANLVTAMVIIVLWSTKRSGSRVRVTEAPSLEKLLHVFPIVGICLFLCDIALLIKKSHQGHNPEYHQWLFSSSQFVSWMMVMFFLKCECWALIFYDGIFCFWWIMTTLLQIPHLWTAFSSSEAMSCLKGGSSFINELVFGLLVNLVRVMRVHNDDRAFNHLEEALLPRDVKKNNDHSKEKDWNFHGFCNLLTFQLVKLMMDLGVSRQLDFQDLIPLPNELMPSSCHANLFKCWLNEQSKSPTSPSLLKAIFSAYGWPYLCLAALKDVRQNEIGLLRILKGANSFIPHIVLGSTVLALAYPPSFTWFTTRYYAPALGFLMFAVGINSSPEDFNEAINRPGVLFTGYVGQFVIKPLLGYLFGALSVTAVQLPSSIGVGIMLVSCVSGAQLSNYAAFLTDPAMAPLSIVMTSLSTATAVFVTPALSLLLIGKKLPVDVRGMMSSITQIVVVPIAAGLLLNRLLPRVCAAIQPFLPPLSVLVTALCVGSPLAINVEAIVSPFGITVLLLILGFHASSFVAGYFLPAILFHKASDVKALQRTLSFETGMQSSLLALALANRFFQDPLVGVPPAISVVLMSLMGFSLVMLWSRKNSEV